ncbi:hypothetical protein M6B38_149480 [Iris pallida]|uniref:Uncharacterized protein n=1 Tax=Iris pallida TaxID=29817 RepID=A0AAX6F7N4_IRIPA|nr:hypothetical protein M6B38_149480 [Iris pallida]
MSLHSQPAVSRSHSSTGDRDFRSSLSATREQLLSPVYSFAPEEVSSRFGLVETCPSPWLCLLSVRILPSGVLAGHCSTLWARVRDIS